MRNSNSQIGFKLPMSSKSGHIGLPVSPYYLVVQSIQRTGVFISSDLGEGGIAGNLRD